MVPVPFQSLTGVAARRPPLRGGRDRTSAAPLCQARAALWLMGSEGAIAGLRDEMQNNCMLLPKFCFRCALALVSSCSTTADLHPSVTGRILSHPTPPGRSVLNHAGPMLLKFIAVLFPMIGITAAAQSRSMVKTPVSQQPVRSPIAPEAHHFAKGLLSGPGRSAFAAWVP